MVSPWQAKAEEMARMNQMGDRNDGWGLGSVTRLQQAMCGERVAKEERAPVSSAQSRTLVPVSSVLCCAQSRWECVGACACAAAVVRCAGRAGWLAGWLFARSLARSLVLQRRDR